MRFTPWSRHLGRVVLICGTATGLLVTAPAVAIAEPPEVQVPDDGARPDGDPGTVGGDPLPSAGDVPIAGPGVSRGPYANRIAELARNVAELGEATTAADETVTLRTQTRVAAFDHWVDRRTRADTLNELVSEMAAQAYLESGSQIRGVTDQFEDLFRLNPGLLTDDLSSIQRTASAAASDAEVALAGFDAAVAAESIAVADRDRLVDELDELNRDLEDLIDKNAEAVALQEEQAARDNERHLDDIGTDVDGWQAAPAAQDAVRYAVEQVGKPYEWGAEGPDTFDCSGLVQTAYAKQGIQLPRVANDQFRATQTMAVDVSKMLPGDLIFYGDKPGQWTSVYHVGMYIGDGQMVHAPRPGDTVKVVPVWFSDFFGAHRVVAAVKVDDGDSGDDKPQEPQEPSPEPSDTPEPTPSEEARPPSEDPSSDTPPNGPSPTPTPTG